MTGMALFLALVALTVGMLKSLQPAVESLKPTVRLMYSTVENSLSRILVRYFRALCPHGIVV